MNEVRMPDGGKAWFVRTRGRGCHIKPASSEGHLLSAGFVAWVTLVATWLVHRDHGIAQTVSAIALILASTLLYLVTVMRMSAPCPREGGRG